VNFYQNTYKPNPEEESLHIHCRGILKSKVR